MSPRRVLVTGPSGSGKSTVVVHAVGGDRVVHLDADPLAAAHDATADDAAADDSVVVLEGLPSGSAPALRRLLRSVDLVVVVDAPVRERVARVVRRDGWRGLPLWAWNEWHWRRTVAPVVSSHERRLTVVNRR